MAIRFQDRSAPAEKVAGMKVLFLADLHWSGQRALSLPEELEACDLVVLGGDISNFCGKDVIRQAVERVRKLCPKVLAVCGNCDLPEGEEVLRELDIDLDGRRRELGGVTWLGLSGGLPFGGCPYERTEAEYEQAAAHLWRQATTGTVILVSHQPPFGVVCDRTRGRHVGCMALRRAIEAHQPALVLCGHIHEGSGTDQIGGSMIANPGPWMSRRYLTFDLEEGEIKDLKLLLA